MLRLLCLFGFHCWQLFTSSTPEVHARRTCARCGLWQKHVPDESGWSAGSWVRF